MGLNRADLEKLCPRPSNARKAEQWDDYVDALCEADGLFEENGIDTTLELCHILAQWAHETGGFTILWESGAYTADGLMRIFGKGVHSAGITRAEAERLVALSGEAKAKAIFERVYGLGNPKKAKELGNTEPGDGYLYRGFGIVQITGRRDHERLLDGDYTARGAIRAALMEWGNKGCGADAARDDCRRITRKINGGYNGFEDRQRYLAKAKRIWKEDPDWNTIGHGIPSEPVHEPDPVDVAVPGPVSSPKSMAESKTGNTAIAVGGTGGVMALSQTASAGKAVVATLEKDAGSVSVFFSLLGDVPFMLAATTALVMIAGPIFIWWDRREKMRRHGI